MKRLTKTTFHAHDEAMPLLTNADLDAALDSAQDMILPSSGFADSVMAAVAREAGTPAPIPFPWLRALPGITVAAVVVGALLAAMMLAARDSAALPPAGGFPQRLLLPLFDTAGSAEGFGVMLSGGIAGACLLLCRRLMGAR